MRARSRRGAFGLRGRIVGAVLVTTVATLAVAAVALLGPLEHSLRNAEQATLKQELAGSRATAAFTTRRFDPAKVAHRKSSRPRPAQTQGTGGASISPTSGRQRPARRQSAVQRRRDRATQPGQAREPGSPSGASEVALLGYADASGSGS